MGSFFPSTSILQEVIEWEVLEESAAAGNKSNKKEPNEKSTNNERPEN